jgi:hypothetical protein
LELGNANTHLRRFSVLAALSTGVLRGPSRMEGRLVTEIVKDTFVVIATVAHTSGHTPDCQLLLGLAGMFVKRRRTLHHSASFWGVGVHKTFTELFVRAWWKLLRPLGRELLTAFKAL